MKPQAGPSANSITRAITGVIILLVLLGVGLYVGFSLTNTSTVSTNPAFEEFADYDTQSIIINDEIFNVYIADTSSRRVQGLSGITWLDENEGLLFNFNESGQHPFWMKDMNFAIDIIWLDSDYRVVHIERNVSPDTYPNTFGGDVDSQYVLEVNSEQVNGIEIGDTLHVTGGRNN